MTNAKTVDSGQLPAIVVAGFADPPVSQLRSGCRRSCRQRRREAKVLVLLVISLSSIMGMVGLVLDTGLLISGFQDLHHATDAAAMAAAMDLLLGKTPAAATATASSYVATLNGLADAVVTVNIPPLQGAFAGQSNCVEVIATRVYQTHVMQIVGANSQQSYHVRSVAGYQPSTAGTAIVVLNPTPSPLTISPVPPLLPSYPALIGGLEVLGSGTAAVNGAVLVDTTWGGVDENGNPAGSGPGPPYGITCTPILALTHLNATDIRVAGGVDTPTNYGNYVSGKTSPLHCNRLPAPDPYLSLPVPTTTSDPVNVSPQLQGGVQVIGLPLIGAPTVLQPGVYEWIEIDSGQVVFQPGIYIIRNVNPLTGIALNIVAGTVTANGVMFYVTNSTNYDATLGAPDSSDGSTAPAATPLGGLIPSVSINAALSGSSFSPLASPGSPFNGMLLFQRREDYNPIVIVQSILVGSASFSGALYAKWGSVLFEGSGTYNVQIVAGTAALVPLMGMTFSPSTLLPPAQDVYLVE
jgi:hypothetical protein